MRGASVIAARSFQDAFGGPPARGATVPGRVELLGNHTDHNAGLVLAATIDQALQFACAPRTDGNVELVSSAFPGQRIQFPATNLRSTPTGSWAEHVRAVLGELRREGVPFGGFNAAIHSTIPVGGGLSSSAALLVAVALAIGHLPHGTAAERLRVAQLCQRAERRLGVDCGLLDYLTILHGRAGEALRLDCRSLIVRSFPWPRELALVLADSGVRHRLTDGGYNSIRRACASAARKLGVPTLREAGKRSLVENGDRLAPREAGAASHIIDENARVRAALAALREGDAKRLGALLAASHESSRTLLRNSCPELDALLAQASRLSGWLGGRLSGGGFGGMTVHLVRRRHLRRFLEAMPTEAGAAECRLGDGARVEGHDVMRDPGRQLPPGPRVTPYESRFIPSAGRTRAASR